MLGNLEFVWFFPDIALYGLPIGGVTHEYVSSMIPSSAPGISALTGSANFPYVLQWSRAKTAVRTELVEPGSY